jgi:hypothetical protein
VEILAVVRNLDDRIRRIVISEEHAMSSSRTTVGLAAALLVLPVVLVRANAQTVDRPSPPAGQEEKNHSLRERALRNSRVRGVMRRPRDPNAPPWRPGPVPAVIPIHIAGMARDEAGRAIAGATITLYPIDDIQGRLPLGSPVTLNLTCLGPRSE